LSEDINNIRLNGGTMKYLYGFLIVLISTSAFAGEYYNSRIDTYDPVTGFYYKAIEKSPEGGSILSSKSDSNIILNIAIFDPSRETTSLLFKEDQKNGISVFLFETGFKDGHIEFNNSTDSGYILNNTRVAKRGLKDKLLIGVQNNQAKETILFVSDRKGNNLKKLIAVPYTADWHIDVKNSKLRVVRPTGKTIHIDSYVW
jgi:hypothetical protein